MEKMSGMTLEAKNATLGYGKTAVLKNVCFELKTGQVTCVLGRNGSGKTTLFKSLLGILPLLSGEILLDGKRTDKWSRRMFARMVGYVPQAHAVPFPYTVSEVVLFGRTAHLSRFASPGKKDRLIAEECMERLQIGHLKDRIFTRLSGGEQQLVIVARALAQQPLFLIMDEPASNLDFGNQIKLINRINDFKSSELGVLMATHSPDHVFMCDADALIVHDGGIWKHGYCGDVMAEEVLNTIYGVDVSVCSVRKHAGGQSCTKHTCPKSGTGQPHRIYNDKK
ncbi:MAG: ABC transporter ATP-binding protein [Bacteroidales bacterium]|jgi:iron complex transport system ATP-binding protein|nr:ABC transporter ATP-binding protein [Bacteroidales bacterium]